MQSIASMFKQVSARLMVLSYTVGEFSKIFHILLNYIKSAPEDNFESPGKKSFKEVPLYFTKKGERAIQEKLSEFPHVFQTGGARFNWQKLKELGFAKKGEKDPGHQESHPSFLYLMGQVLSALAIKIDFLEFKDKEFYKKHEDEFKALFKIWGSKENMNAYHLFSDFESMNNASARKKMENKISDSIAILDKIDTKI